MAYTPRLFRPDELYFITSRTVDGMLFLRPSDEINSAIGSVLADAQERYGVELFEFVFLSNHMHLTARSRHGRLPAFMQYLKANIAIVVNRTLGRHGPVWEGRYTASPIVDDEALIERAKYIYGHGVKEGLVERAEQWPGVASVKERLSGVRPTYHRLDRTALSRCRLSGREVPDRFRRALQVSLSPWPFLNGLAPPAAVKLVRRLVDLANRGAQEVRSPARVLGIEAVLFQDPWEKPHTELERRPKPRCHASSQRRRRGYQESFALFLADYAQASQLFRAGEVDVSFPPYAHRPPLPLGWLKAVPSPAV